MAGWVYRIAIAVCLLNAVAADSSRAQNQQQEGSAFDQQEASGGVSDPDTSAASSVNPASPFDDRNFRFGRQTFSNFAQNQKAIWTSPAQLRFSDADWLLPIGGLTAGLLATDSDVSPHLSFSPKIKSRYDNLTNAGIAALVGGAGGVWLFGHAARNDHWRESGFLAGEAAVNALVAVEAFKYSLGRQRPFQGDGTGPFFHGGTSFPSEHSAAAWAVAGVIAHEYPGPLTRIAAYGLASLVSYSRIRARQHFPSDVFVGGLIGDMVGQNVYSVRHDPELGGEAWTSLRELTRSDGTPPNQGSPYVPLDSWIYPAMERLAGLGLIHEEFMGMRPWTRVECARLVTDALGTLTDSGNDNNEAARLIEALQREFRQETEAANANDPDAAGFRLESLYSRSEHISGTPLNDGYTLAQTQINDFGRPYGEGWNTVNGFSAYATSGRWVAYFRGEAQTAPEVPGFSLATRQFIQQVDFYPVLPPGGRAPAVDQFQVLDAYVATTYSNWQLSFGKQSLWWGPGEGSSLMISDNAQPINMFRINRVSPFRVPFVQRILGPMRFEFFVGQLAGQRFVNTPAGVLGDWNQTLSPQPFIHGEKLSFQPTPNIEVGLSRTTIFAGEGIPFTTHTFLRSLLNIGHFTGVGSDPAYPGDRLSGLDFTYRIPKLRNWLSIYADGYANDQIIFLPTGYPDRAIWIAGAYLSRFPRIPKLDLRVEGGYTSSTIGSFYDTGYYYTNIHYLSGYTNEGNIIGSWLGRGAQGEQAWSNYWFTPRTRLQVNFRHQNVSQKFLPNGGSLTDVGVRGEYLIHSNIGISLAVQREHWLFLVIQPGAQNNTSATVQISFQPQTFFGKTHSPAETDSVDTGGRP